MTPIQKSELSIILPAKNEARSLEILLPQLKESFVDSEIIVVDDGSNDDTASICSKYEILRVHHPYSMGNGAAIKSGARSASRKINVFMDADGQHKIEDISKMLDLFQTGNYDMVVGSRDKSSQTSKTRLFANSIYNTLSSWIVGQRISDLTSGFRVVRANRFRKFLYLLPNGFSYPTTITMCFFRSGFKVGYLPIKTEKRIGKSHISITKDGIRFLLIIFRIGTLYSPLKLFVPVSALHFIIGATYYGYTFLTSGRFTNMSALLFISSIIIFLIGLVSEQITALLYQDSDEQ